VEIESSETMKAAEEELGGAADDGDPPDTKQSSQTTLFVDVGLPDANHRVGENEEEEGKSDVSQTPDDPDLLREWDPSRNDVATPKSPIDYSNMNKDEVPYEHNFQPGDHIIRWDMLPILWPIQIHGIVLEVSEDKSEVTICDFGVTSVKNNVEDKKIVELQVEQNEKNVEEENAKFSEAIQDECPNNGESYESTDTSTAKKETSNKKNQRLHKHVLTKWSDLKKWHKVNYEGGLLNVGSNGVVGKGLKNLGKKSEELWTWGSTRASSARTSMTKPFATTDVAPKNNKKVWRSVRHEIDDKGFCAHHPDIQLKRLKDSGDWAVVRKKCPGCIMEDCPAMMGEESAKSRASLQAEDENPVSESETAAPEETLDNLETKKSEKPTPSLTRGDFSQSSVGDSNELPEDKVSNDNEGTDLAKESDKLDEPKALAQMMAEANEIERRSRKTIVKVVPTSPKKKPTSPEKKSIVEKQKLWRGSLMKSLSNIFPQQNEKEASTNVDSTAGEKSLHGEIGQEAMDSKEQPNTPDNLPRSDPPILVLARTKFILEHGESVLPPYHIINSNSECIAVWCKTGRWSTLQASVFLHSTAIGHAKSATALTLGVAATQPWLIPAFATVGLAAVGTPWLYLKIANDKWNEATMSLTEKFWLQAEPEVFVICIEKWGNIK